MQFPMFLMRRWYKVALLVVLVTGSRRVPAADTAPNPKPSFLYSRYLNAAGEDRYKPDGTYKEVLKRLPAEFDVQVNGEKLDRTILQRVKVVLIANPSDKAVGKNPPPHHVNTNDIF